MDNLPQEIQPATEPVLTPIESSQVDSKNGQGMNVFLAVLISVVIILLLFVAAWFLARKYLWQVQQDFVANQFQTLDIKIQNLNSDLAAEKAVREEVMTNVQSMEKLLQELEAEKTPSAIETYMQEEFVVPVDWQTYTNDDWGIEFQYPADWEAYKMDSSPIVVQELGSDELFQEYRDEMQLKAETGEISGVAFVGRNPYISNLQISFLEEEVNVNDLKNNEAIDLDYISVGDNNLYAFIDPQHGGTSYQIFVEVEGEIKFSIVLLRNYEFNKIQTELNILKTLKFNK